MDSARQSRLTLWHTPSPSCPPLCVSSGLPCCLPASLPATGPLTATGQSRPCPPCCRSKLPAAVLGRPGRELGASGAVAWSLRWAAALLRPFVPSTGVGTLLHLPSVRVVAPDLMRQRNSPNPPPSGSLLKTTGSPETRPHPFPLNRQSSSPAAGTWLALQPQSPLQLHPPSPTTHRHRHRSRTCTRCMGGLALAWCARGIQHLNARVSSIPRSRSD